MSFINKIDLGRSAINNIKNLTWSVHPYYKIYEDEGEAIVAYVRTLEKKNRELEEKIAGTEKEN